MSEKIATRIAYGEALKEFGADTKIFVLDADLCTCTESVYFRNEYPDRFFNIGIAEANMVGIAAGLASTGKTVFVNSFAMFSAGKAFEQIRNSVAYPRLNVKVIGTHVGLTIGEDGATHQCVEDIAIMRAIPGMTVISPCDANETREAVKAMVEYDGPCYMRLGRFPVSIVTDRPGYKFELGKGALLEDGGDVTIAATGMMVAYALGAREQLQKEGISARVLDIHTIKPIDKELLIRAAEETGAIVTAEEHNVLGGLGGAVAEAVCEQCPIPVVKVGVQDVFGHSGKPLELLERYGLTVETIVAKAKHAISMKK